MDKIVDIKQLINEKNNETENVQPSDVAQKITNPIKKTDSTVLKNLAKFANSDISKKFSVKDLLK